MPVKSVRIYTFALLALDILAIVAAFTVAYVLRVQFDPRPVRVSNIYALEFFNSFIVLLPLWLLVISSLGLYTPQVYQKRLTEYGKLFVVAFIGVLLMIGYEYVVDKPIFPARLVPVYGGIASFLFLVIGRELLRQLRNILFSFGVGVQRVMVIGHGRMTTDIVKNFGETGNSGYKVIATAGIRAHGSGAEHFLSLKPALDSLDKLDIDTIIHTELDPSDEVNMRILSAAQERHIQYCFIPGEAEFYSGKNQIDVFLGYPMISVYQTPLVGWGEVAKRIFDLALIIILSPLWIPIMVLLMLLQKIFNPGPIFFTSPRLGLHGKVINTYKFRSMNPKYSGKDAAKIFRSMGREDLAKEYEKTRKIDNDPRITPFGKLLRVTSLDEAAQVFNVIRGDMSLIGPRPIIKEEREFYREKAPLLFSVKPGITGLWQVSGRSDLSFKERVELELYYAQNWSFWLDLKILFKTVGVVLFRKGAK